MNKEEVKEFFECLGEIWQDIAIIEFLMRCAISKYDNEIDKHPKPPYYKGKVFEHPPGSFKLKYFSDVVREFNVRSPDYYPPNELVELRNALAHGFIVGLEGNVHQELIKFKKSDGDKITVDFHMKLELNTIVEMAKAVRDYMKTAIKLASD